MKKRDEKLLKLCNELASIYDYACFEELLDEMTLSLLQGQENEKTKADAYWMVVNLKKLLKVACNDFFGYDSLKEVFISQPKNDFEHKLAKLITEDLERSPRWEIKKRMN